MDTRNRPQTDEMRVIHALFRTHLDNLPALLGRVDDGDRERAGVLVTWLEELLTALHHHHVGEDELMWPLLTGRAPQDRSLVLRMEEQHSRIADLVTACHRHATAFAASGSAVDGATLAGTVTDLSDALTEHLAEEELHILPLVEQVMSVEEWQALADRGNASIPKDRRLEFLGFMLHAATADQRAVMLTALPLPARVLWRLFGKAQFARSYERVYGAAPRW